METTSNAAINHSHGGQKECRYGKKFCAYSGITNGKHVSQRRATVTGLKPKKANAKAGLVFMTNRR